MADFELIVNIFIIILLVPTILYTYRLNKNLNILRHNQDSLAKLVAALNEATFKAENSIPKLKSVTEHSSEGLKEVVENAKELKDDLTFINERADNLADRLEQVISDSRGVRPVVQPQTPRPAPTTDAFGRQIPEEERSLAEMELLKALRSIK